MIDQGLFALPGQSVKSQLMGLFALPGQSVKSQLMGLFTVSFSLYIKVEVTEHEPHRILCTRA